MAGNSVHTGNDTTDDGANDSTPSHADPVMALKASLTGDADRPVVASINEMCRNQFNALMNQLQSAEPGMDWRGVFAVAKSPADSSTDSLCYQGGSEHDYGNALISHRMVAGSVLGPWSLPYPTSETRKMMCVTLALAVNVKACNTHIATLDSWDVDACTQHSRQNAQIRDVAVRVNGYVNGGDEVILMGDFNREPTSGGAEDCEYAKLDALYDRDIFGGGAFGLFKEVGQWDSNSTYNFTPSCRCGDLTHKYTSSGVFLNRKIDFIFANSRDWVLDDAEDTGNANSPIPDKDGRVSDHKILRGKAHLRH
jgi:endonuclease/exonuclease/phosphatase family metal-dependent hydrolase